MVIQVVLADVGHDGQVNGKPHSRFWARAWLVVSMTSHSPWPSSLQPLHQPAPARWSSGPAAFVIPRPVSHSGHQTDFIAGLVQHPMDQEGRGGFAVGSGDADDFHCPPGKPSRC